MSTPRPSWDGVIRFGLVDIEVQLIAVTVDPKSDFISVHAAAGHIGTVKQDRVCEECAKTVDTADLSRAVPTTGGPVLISDVEIEDLATPSRKVIVLDQFKPVQMLRPAYYERAYYVAPKSIRDAIPCGTLRRALALKGEAGIGKIAFLSRERLAAISVDDAGNLMLYALHFPAEMREPPHPFGDGEVLCRDEDIRAAAVLMDAINQRGHFSSAGPDLSTDRYRDGYTDGLATLVADKKGTAKPARYETLDKALTASVTRQRRATRKPK